MKINNFFCGAFFFGSVILSAGCTTTQGEQAGAQLGDALGRAITGAPPQPRANSSSPALVGATASAAAQQQQLAASPGTAKVEAVNAPMAAGTVASISYQELVKLHADDSGDPRKAYGKSVRVSVNGKGDIGYFLKKSDGITFVCDSGDKTLTANKTTKGSIQGVVSNAQEWEGATVYHLKDCQIVK